MVWLTGFLLSVKIFVDLCVFITALMSKLGNSNKSYYHILTYKRHVSGLLEVAPVSEAQVSVQQEAVQLLRHQRTQQREVINIEFWVSFVRNHITCVVMLVV